MSATFLGNETPNTPEWDKLRATGLGGSEIAAVVGLSPWVSRFALWHRKRGTLGRQEVTPSMNWGQRLEPVILAAWQESHPELAPQPGGTFRRDDEQWMIANPDRVVDGGIVEVKTADKYDAFEWGPSGSDIIPPYYLCQGQWYADVLGVERIFYAVLIGGNDYREYEISYSAEDAAWLRDQGREFWQSVIDGVAPPIDESDVTYEAIRELHPEIDGSDVEIAPKLWEAYLEADDQSKRWKGSLTCIKSQLLDQMGNARRGLVLGQPVVRREARGNGRPYLKAIPQPKEDAA